ncbi:stalk domain-containing protein [Priestia megaterium]
MLKKLVLLIIFAIGAAGLSSQNASAATTPPSVYVDGNLLSLSNQPFVKDGTTYIPVREIAQKLGLKVIFDGSSNIITFRHPYRSTDLTHKIGTSSICTDKVKCKTLQSKSVEKNGVTYVPIRLFEAFDATVYWDSGKNSIYVYSYDLRQLQAVVFSNYAYEHTISQPIGKDLKDIDFNKMVEINTTFKKAQDILSIYPKDVNGNVITTDKFVKNYARLGEWEIATYLLPKDFNSIREYNQMVNSGFQGIAFRNWKTNEFMIAFGGTDFSDTNGDVETDLKTLADRVNPQKKYAYKLFEKVTLQYNKPKIYLTGHSLGGNLAQATARNYPNNYAYLFTFNALGINSTTNTPNIVNSVTDLDIVSQLNSQYGRKVVFKGPSAYKAHSLYNFYGYYYTPSTMYWGSNVPYKEKSNYLWTY